MAGYRFNLKNWLAVEGDYDYFRNSQKFLSSSGTTFIPMNVHDRDRYGDRETPFVQDASREDRVSICSGGRRSNVLRSACGICE